MLRSSSLFPLAGMLLAGLILLGLGLWGLQSQVEADRLRERERLRALTRVEAKNLRKEILRPQAWKESPDSLRFRMTSRGELSFDPAPIPPNLEPPFGPDRNHPLLRAWSKGDTHSLMGSGSSGISALKPGPLRAWLRARLLLRAGEPEKALRLVRPYRESLSPPGWPGPFLRLLLELGEAPPAWALSWLAGRSEAEILALDPVRGGAILTAAYLRARARSARFELGDLGLLSRSLPFVLPLRGGRDLLFAFSHPKGGVQGLLLPFAKVWNHLGARLPPGTTLGKGPFSSGSQAVGEEQGFSILPGIILRPLFPEEPLGKNLLLLYILAGGILLLSLWLAARSLVKERWAFLQREDFLRSATHELKTPLASLRLLLESLVSGRIKSEAKKAEYLRLLQGETERLSALVGQGLGFSKC